MWGLGRSSHPCPIVPGPRLLQPPSLTVPYPHSSRPRSPEASQPPSLTAPVLTDALPASQSFVFLTAPIPTVPGPHRPCPHSPHPHNPGSRPRQQPLKGFFQRLIKSEYVGVGAQSRCFLNLLRLKNPSSTTVSKIFLKIRQARHSIYSVAS